MPPRGLRASIGINAGESKAALERKIATEGFDLLVMGAYQTLADFALHLITATAHDAALDESSARRAIAQTATNNVNKERTLITAG